MSHPDLESHRRTNGQFGHQPRADNDGTILGAAEPVVIGSGEHVTTDAPDVIAADGSDVLYVGTGTVVARSGSRVVATGGTVTSEAKATVSLYGDAQGHAAGGRMDLRSTQAVACLYAGAQSRVHAGHVRLFGDSRAHLEAGATAEVFDPTASVTGAGEVHYRY